jgi:hypothetical protein
LIENKKIVLILEWREVLGNSPCHGYEMKMSEGVELKASGRISLRFREFTKDKIMALNRQFTSCCSATNRTCNVMQMRTREFMMQVAVFELKRMQCFVISRVGRGNSTLIVRDADEANAQCFKCFNNKRFAFAAGEEKLSAGIKSITQG